MKMDKVNLPFAVNENSYHRHVPRDCLIGITFQSLNAKRCACAAIEREHARSR